MKKLIEALGFTLVSQCSCGGTFTQNFTNKSRFEGIKIVLKPEFKKFEIIKHGRSLAKGKGTPEQNCVELLTEALKKHGIIKEQNQNVETESQEQASEETVPEQ